jgi:hypothetical protein
VVKAFVTIPISFECDVCCCRGVKEQEIRLGNWGSLGTDDRWLIPQGWAKHVVVPRDFQNASLWYWPLCCPVCTTLAEAAYHGDDVAVAALHDRIEEGRKK